MAQFGQFLGIYDPKKENVYKTFCDYFNYPQMIKIKDDETNSHYMIKMSSMMINVSRYLIALVPKDENPVGTRTNLQNLKWDSFQTRTLKTKFNLPIHYINDKSNCKYKLIGTDRNMKITSYTCKDLEINVYLLHTRDNNLWEYPPEGNLEMAFETYQCVVTF